jgi:hypothetical protein
MTFEEYLDDMKFIKVNSNRYVKFYEQESGKVNAIIVDKQKKYVYVYFVNSAGIMHLQNKGKSDLKNFSINDVKQVSKSSVKRIRNYDEFVKKYM